MDARRRGIQKNCGVPKGEKREDLELHIGWNTPTLWEQSVSLLSPALPMTAVPRNMGWVGDGRERGRTGGGDRAKFFFFNF